MVEAYVAADERLAIRDWTVGDLLRHAARSAGSAIALKQSDGGDGLSWTYRELSDETGRLARALSRRFAPGENVAIWGANSTIWILYQLAAAKAGLVLVTLNPALRGKEVGPLLRQSHAVGLIMDETHRGTDLAAIIAAMRDDLPELREVLLMSDWRTEIANAPADGALPVIRSTEPAMILFTSGTTGAPKGVVLTHIGIVNNALLGSERYELDDGLPWLGVLPLFHVGGSVTSTLGCVARLGTNVVVPAFDAKAVLGVIERERIAWFPVVPTMVIDLLAQPEFDQYDLSSLQLVLTGGTIITPDFVRLVRDRFKVGVQVMFGQTEAGGAMAKTLRTDPIETIASSVGRPYPHTAMRIADAQTGETVDAGVSGEIRIRSPFMTSTYYENPDATDNAFDRDGFLRTGDLGTLDEHGYLRVTGRLKDMIIRGGENIYPREIEDALAERPEIIEAAVVGVPHERWGEEVACALRCQAGMTIDTDAVRDFLLTRLARHKVPKLWRIVTDFPRTPSGKIQKFEVVRWFDKEVV